MASRLAASVRSAIGDNAYGPDGRLLDWRSGLLPGHAKLLDQLDVRVDGARLRQAEGGPAMAFNSFLPWLSRPAELSLDDEQGFAELRLNARCPAGVRGTPPPIDLLALKPRRVVAVIAQGAAWLRRRSKRMADSYGDIEVGPKLRPWLEQVRAADGTDGGYEHLDPAALAKFALGLDRTFPQYHASVLYLYWDTGEAADAEPFASHRRELSRFNQAIVEGEGLPFAAQSFGDLWQAWTRTRTDPWIGKLVVALQGRYGLAVAEKLGRR